MTATSRTTAAGIPAAIDTLYALERALLALDGVATDAESGPRFDIDVTVNVDVVLRLRPDGET